MLTPADKELDRLSREAADQFEPDEDISSWERLEPLLDKGLGDKPPGIPRGFRWKPVGFMALILAVAGLSYFFIAKRNAQHKPVVVLNQPSANSSASEASKGEKAKQSTADQSTGNGQTLPAAHGETKTPQDGTDVSAANKADNSKSAPGAAASTTGAVSQADQSVSDKSTGSANQPTAKNKNNHPGLLLIPGAADGLSTPSPGSDKGNKPAANNPKSGAEQTGDIAAVTGLPDPLGLNGDKNLSSTRNAIGPVGLATASLPALAAAGSHSPVVNDSSLRKWVPRADSATAGITNPNKSNSRSLHLNRRLKIGAFLAPDVTTVNDVAPSKLSFGGGITIGYQLFNRFSVNTGLIYTKKNYAANGKDFHAPANTFPPYINPDYVDGNCNMWEIPLTVRYDLSLSGKSTLFVNAGMSSYLMKHENYAYSGHYYYNGMLRPWYKEAQYDTHKNYWFSVINLSFGVEHQVSKTLSVQVEPFFRIPVSGVGFGQLELSSYGIGFSLRYAPLIGKSRR